jgi:hypothetical protein
MLKSPAISSPFLALPHYCVITSQRHELPKNKYLTQTVGFDLLYISIFPKVLVIVRRIQ